MTGIRCASGTARIGEIAMFHSLRGNSWREILEIELANVRQRVTVLGLKLMRFHLAPAALEFLLSEGTDMKCGIQALEMAIEQYVVNPTRRLMATDQVKIGEMLLIDRHPGGKGLAFWRARFCTSAIQTEGGCVLKIQRSGNGGVVFKLSGRIEAQDVGELQELLALEAAGQQLVLDLRDVTLVNQEAVQFLGSCEAEGIKLANCPLYIRAWIDQAQDPSRQRRQ